MSEFAIRAESLGKRYPIGAAADRHDQLRFAIAAAVKAPLRNFRNIRRLGRAPDDRRSSVWALRDASFDVRPGEVVGIVGRNGAGKSTLLKILSRITRPTTGYAEVGGRVASLLEVGTGFHPELTGRENVYLNGSVLGMARHEITRKFDEIAAFSGVERFLDTPVKRYSSGMYLRLAFSVAAHLESEILIVDEVLAVGDTEFQRKCIGTMEEVAGRGRTVVLVSHNIGAITRLCGRALWLDEGRIRRDGPASAVAAEYLRAGTDWQSSWRNSSAPGGHPVRIDALDLEHDGTAGAVVPFDRHIVLRVRHTVSSPVRNLAILLRVIDMSGNVIFTTWDTDTGAGPWPPRRPGTYSSACTLPANLLRPGEYRVSAGTIVPGEGIISYHDGVLGFEISGMGFPLNLDRQGVISPVLQWTVRPAAPLTDAAGAGSDADAAGTERDGIVAPTSEEEP